MLDFSVNNSCINNINTDVQHVCFCHFFNIILKKKTQLFTLEIQCTTLIDFIYYTIYYIILFIILFIILLLYYYYIIYYTILLL